MLTSSQMLTSWYVWLGQHADLVSPSSLFRDITVHSTHCSTLLQTLTVPYLIDNPEVGYVQTRWVFANPDESYLTKVTQAPVLSNLRCTDLCCQNHQLSFHAYAQP